MTDHPPTQPESISTHPAVSRRRLIAICACAVLVLILGGVFMLWPDTPEIVDARSPDVSPDPAGIRIAFDRGRWTNSVVEVNGTFTCSVGDLEPGVHVIGWSKLQGPTAASLNQSLVRTITVRGEVDGKPRTLDFHVMVGNGFIAISSVERE